ncbi:MAG: hypothetical protein ACPG4T_06530, partial [Nannocystaceae bacterium]
MSANEIGGSRPTRVKRFAYAEKLYHEQHFVESAVEFEALWRTYKNLRYLYNAALARQSAGHLGHAAAYLVQYIKHPETTIEKRDLATRLLEHIRKSLVAVEVRVEGAHAETLRATFHGGFPSQQREAEVTYPLVEQRCTIYLDPGTWQLDAVGKDARSKEFELVVRPAQDPTTADLRMVRTAQSPEPEPERGRPKITIAEASLGLGVGILGAAFLGVGLTGYGQANQSLDGKLANGTDEALDFGALKRPSGFVAAGSGLLGAGMGFAVSGIPSLLRSQRRRRVANTVTLTLGVGLLSVGALATGFLVEDRKDLLGQLSDRSVDLPEYTSISQRGLSLYKNEQNRLLGLSAAVGLGAGLAVGSAIAMLVERVNPSRSKRERTKHGLTPSV